MDHSVQNSAVDQADFEKYFGTLHYFVAIVDGGRIECVNSAGIAMFGFDTKKDMIGCPLSVFVSREYVDVLDIGFSALTEEAEGLPLKLTGSYYREIDAKMWVRRWGSDEDAGDFYLVEIHDLSAHMRAAQALREREQRLSEIIATVADGIVTIDEGRKISTFNPAAENIFGRKFEDVVGMDINLLVPGMDDSVQTEGDQSLLPEVYVEREDGRFIVVECAGRTLPEQRGKTFTWVIRDITARKEREDQRERYLLESEEQRERIEEQAMTMTGLAEEYYMLKDKAESADQLKSRFLANMSHELRTPLNAIIGFSEVMKGQMFGPIDNEQYVQYSSDIYGSGVHLLKLINDILDISKVEAGAQEIFEENIRVKEVIRESVEMVRERAQKKELEITVATPETMLRVYADKVRVKQIFLNLLTNAIKFSPDGSRISIVGSIDDEDRVVVQVIDEGAGVAPEDIATVLEPFGQVADMMTREQEGTGLGLPLCKSFMELHEGALRFESELGKGSVVTLLFPSERTVF